MFAHKYYVIKTNIQLRVKYVFVAPAMNQQYEVMQNRVNTRYDSAM